MELEQAFDVALVSLLQTFNIYLNFFSGLFKQTNVC